MTRFNTSFVFLLTAVLIVGFGLFSAPLLGDYLPWGKSEVSGAQAAPGIVPQIAVVDVEKVMRQSRTAEAGRAHFAQAKERLEKGWKDLQEAVKKEPEQNRKNALAAGLQKLQRQLGIEEAAVNQVVHAQMLGEIQRWRRTNNGVIVVARQNLLDAAPENEITDAVITAMDNGQVPSFPALPEVAVNPPRDESRKAPKVRKQVPPASAQPPARR